MLRQAGAAAGVLAALRQDERHLRVEVMVLGHEVAHLLGERGQVHAARAALLVEQRHLRGAAHRRPPR